MDLKLREYHISLYEIYNELLTEKQKKYFEAYYLDDLSLSEIAENLNVSRNAVFDQIKKTATILEEYEVKLHLLEKQNKIIKLMEEAPLLKQKLEELL